MYIQSHNNATEFLILFISFQFQSLKFLLKASSFSNDENNALSLAIDCVATSNDDRLANQLIEFLLGETDGSPKVNFV